MHSFTVNCKTFSNQQTVAVVVPIPCVEVTCSEIYSERDIFSEHGRSKDCV